jgi:hypothetical protein
MRAPHLLKPLTEGVAFRLATVKPTLLAHARTSPPAKIAMSANAVPKITIIKARGRGGVR